MCFTQLAVQTTAPWPCVLVSGNKSCRDWLPCADLSTLIACFGIVSDAAPSGAWLPYGYRALKHQLAADSSHARSGSVQVELQSWQLAPACFYQTGWGMEYHCFIRPRVRLGSFPSQPSILLVLSPGVLPPSGWWTRLGQGSSIHFFASVMFNDGCVPGHGIAYTDRDELCS